MAQVEVNKTRGAPLDVRAVVGNLDDPKERLEALKLYYEDVRPLGDDNFVFKDKDGTYVLYNPEGFIQFQEDSFIPKVDVGDIASVGRDITSGVTGGISAGSALLTGQLGPQVALPEEAVTVPVAAALGSEAGGQAYDRIIDFIMNLKGGKTPKRRGVAGETIQAATNIAGEIVAPAGLSKVFDNRFTNYLSKKGNNFVRYVLGAGSGKTLKQTTKGVQSGRDLGLTMPTAGAATQSPFLLFVEQRTAQFPTGVGTFVKRIENFNDQLNNTFDDIVADYGPALKEGGEIGQQVKKFTENAGVRFKEKQEELYGAAYDLVPANEKTQLSNVLNLQNELNSKLANAPLALKKSLSDTMDRINDLMKDIETTGGYNLNTLREIRTNLRQDLGGFKGLIGVQPSGERYLQQLYKSLTDDMNGLVNSVGGEDALKALQKADRYTSVNMKNNVEPIINKILKMDADNQAFNFLIAGSKEGDQRLRQVLRQFEPEEQDILKSSLLNKMGFKQNEEEFSARVFLTNYNKLSNSGKNYLFGAPKSSHRAGLDKLIDVIENYNNMDAYKNFSKTGDMIGQIMTTAPLLGMFVDPARAGMALTTSVVGPFATAKLLTNDAFITWLTNSAPKMIKNPRSTSFHINRLLTIGAREDIQEHVLDYITALQESMPELLGSQAEASVPTGEEIGVTTPVESSAINSIISDIKPEAKDKILKSLAQ